MSFYKAIKCIHFKLISVICIGTKCVWIGSYYVKHNKQESRPQVRNNEKQKTKQDKKKMQIKATPEEFASDH